MYEIMQKYRVNKIIIYKKIINEYLIFFHDDF